MRRQDGKERVFVHPTLPSRTKFLDFLAMRLLCKGFMHFLYECEEFVSLW